VIATLVHAGALLRRPEAHLVRAVGVGVLAHLGDAVAFDADHQAVLVVGTSPAANRNFSRRS
jgi:hypothetical protein